MNSNLTWAASLLVVLLAVNALLTAKIAFAPAAVTEPIKWEYRIQSVDDQTFKKEMDELGEQGWELTFARRATTGSLTDESSTPLYEAIFKRPKVIVRATDGTIATPTSTPAF